MAVLAVAAAGALLAPAGYAALGWTVGMAVGQMLFPGRLPDVQGPRIGDLRAQQSTYGAGIPLVYGTYRVAGNVIWSSDLIEVANTQEVGGKGGGPSQTQTTYTYFVSMAVMLCEGPIAGVRKIWADGHLIYNIDATADAGTIAASARIAPGITVYTGSTTQQPDPLMQAYLGVGNVPAYRGRAYVVIETLPLERFGNRPPNLTFEVVTTSTSSVAFQYFTLPSLGGGNAYSDIATDGTQYVSLGFGSFAVSRSFDGLTWSPPQVLGGVNNGWSIDYLRGRWIVGGSNNYATSADAVSWTLHPANPFQIRRWADNGTIIVGVGPNGFVSTSDFITWTPRTPPSAQGWIGVVWTGSRFVAVAINGTTAFSFDGINWQAGTATGLAADVMGIAWSGTTLVVVRQNATAGVATSTDNGVSWTLRTIPSALWGRPLWTGSQFFIPGGNAPNGYATSPDGVTWAVTAQVEAQNFVSAVAVDRIVTMVSNSGTTMRGAQVRFDIITPSTVTLASVVTNLCARAGLTGSDIDVTGLTDPVDGYAVSRQMPAREALEPLLLAYYCDAVESGNVVAFRRRASAPVATIPADELAAHSWGDQLPEDLPITRQQESELPARVSVAYVNPAADYQQSVQHAQRVATVSRQQSAIEVPIALSDDRARRMAETILYDTWTARSRYRLQLSRRWARLEPADVVTITRNGTTHRLRLVRKSEPRTGVLGFEAVADEASVYTQTALGGASVPGDSVVRFPPLTRLEFIDAPLLRDQDNSQGLYVAACGYTPGWRGTVLYRSADGGASFDETAAIVNASPIGYATTALPNFVGGNIVDESSTVDVFLFSGQLSSITLLALLNGGNAAMLGSELIQFRDAVLIGPNQYRLTGLLRGRRGTEWAQTTHVVNERFVLLSPTTTRRIAAELNLARTYRPVTIGRTIQETPDQAFTYTGVNLECLSPVQLTTGRVAGDVIISWTRRGRISAEWNDNADIPLGEASESYDIEWWNPTFTTLRRTVSGSSLTTTTYTAAQQATDAGGVLATYGVRVFQLSAVVGRGYALQGVV